MGSLPSLFQFQNDMDCVILQRVLYLDCLVVLLACIVLRASLLLALLPFSYIKFENIKISKDLS